MAVINLDYVGEKHIVEISSAEKEVIGYINSNLPLAYNEIIEKDNRWEVFYHLSNLREKIINWYPFKKECTVLELGGDLGAITTFLCKIAKEVTCLERSEGKARAIAKRLSSINNLEVVATTIDFFKATKKYDYIIIENLECKTPLIEIISFLKSILNENGKLLFLIEDKLGKTQISDNSEAIVYTKEEVINTLPQSRFLYNSSFYPLKEFATFTKEYKNLPTPLKDFKTAKSFFDSCYILEASDKNDDTAKDYFEMYEKEQKDKYIIHLKGRIAKYTDKISQQNKVIDEMQNSICWKVTSPGRAITKGLSGNKFLDKLTNAKALIAKNGLGTTFSNFFGNNKLKKTYKDFTEDNLVTNEQLLYQRKLVFKHPEKFSIVCPLYNTPDDYLRDLIESILDQSYTNFELCLADGSDKETNIVNIINSYNDPRIRYKKLEKNNGISANTNEAIKMITGSYIGFIDHDDTLAPSALFEYMKTINNTGATFLYCDEDKFTNDDSNTFDPYFKPDFCIDNLRANNYICHFTVCKRELILKAGPLNSDFDGSQDHDFVLRLSEHASKIVHIPMILYHWRISETSVAKDPSIKEYTVVAGQNAVLAHLNRQGIKAGITSSEAHPNIYRINYDIVGTPQITIIIKSAGDLEMLSKTIESIVENADYNNFNILLVPHKDTNYEEILQKSNKISVMTSGYSKTYGEYIAFIKDNVIITSKGFLTQMLEYAQREDVSAVTIRGTDENGDLIIPPFSRGMNKDENAEYIYNALDDTKYGYFGRMCYTFDITSIKKDCFMIKRELFQSLDTAVMELSKQLNKSGYICYNPNASYELQ
ncbi:MAG: glycosyltransferase [Clostridia bacterium]